MRIASRKGHRTAAMPRTAKKRSPRRMPDRKAPEADRRLFAQLSVSAVLVAVAVLVGMTGGGLKDNFAAMIGRSADLSQVNEVLNSMTQSVPVLSSLFDEEATPVWSGIFGAEDEGGEDLPASDGGGYAEFVIAPEQDLSTSAQPEEGEFVSGFDEEAFDALPDITEGEGGGMVGAAAYHASFNDAGAIMMMTLVTEDPRPEETEDGREVPENSTMIKVPMPIKLVSPLKGEVSSQFGSRGDAMESEFHHGLDIAATKGTAIGAIAAGKVAEVSSNGVYGNYVVLEHDGKVTSKYAHCAKVTVSVGDRVKAGDKIATVGSTGLSTGNHVHLEVRIDGLFVNPAHYITVEQ